jgi:hypothetical protein
MSTPPRVGTHPGTGEGCAEELASLTAALSVGRGRVGGMIDGVGRRRGRVMHTAVSEQYAEPAGGLTAIARCVPSEDLNLTRLGRKLKNLYRQTTCVVVSTSRRDAARRGEDEDGVCRAI